MRDTNRELPVESILRTWLGDPDLTIFCGDWNNGAVMELLPRGEAHLSGGRYESPFDGLRELRLQSAAHHVHLDLRRLTRVWYRIAPSVCFGFRPSFEVLFNSDGTDPRKHVGLGVALSHPYSSRQLRTVAIRRYLHRAHMHATRYPEVVEIQCERAVKPGSDFDDWPAIDALISEVSRSMEHVSGFTFFGGFPSTTTKVALG